ncbi:uncharacterized protein LOC111122949 [Crassostrea virginica]
MHTLMCLSIVLLRSTFISCSQENFSISDVWIDRCTLHTEYTVSSWNNTCSSKKYRIIIKDQKDLQLTSTDTDVLTYSYNGINSTSQITVKVAPIYSCGSEYEWGNRQQRSINGTVVFPSSTLELPEGKNLAIKCPISGAYENIHSITWSQTMGNNNTSLRQFTSNSVILVNGKFEDTSNYAFNYMFCYCTVFPSSTLELPEGKNLAIKCPISGAYENIHSITWSQTMGNNNTSLRQFTSNSVILVNGKFEDTGKYIYTVEYQECGQPPERLLKKDGFVSVNFRGPPIFSTVRVNILPGSKLSFLIHVISLPGAPHQNVTFENAYGITLAVNASRISSSIFPCTSHGKVVNVNGYEMDVMLRNVSNEWISNVTVYVSNSLGKRGYFMIPDNKTLEHHPNVLVSLINKNKLAVYVIGGGVLLLVISISVFVIFRMKKKTKGIQLNGVNEIPANISADVDVVDHLYSSCHSNNMHNGGKDTPCGYVQISDKERIQKERQQIASLYSFGGFSLSEFQEDESHYHNEETNNTYKNLYE